jgi:hypothetical protein
MFQRLALCILLTSACDSAEPGQPSTGDDVAEIPSDDVGPIEPPDLPDDQPDCAGTLGCECIDGTLCVHDLECRSGTCSPCPEGNPGCPCAAGACDLDLVCVADLCEWPTLLDPPG